VKKLILISLLLIVASSSALAFSGAVLITDARITALKSRIAGRVQPTYQAYQALKTYVDSHQFEACQAPALFDTSPTNRADVGRIDHDSVLAYKLALAYRLTGNETYAANSARILNCWATKVTFSPTSPTKLVVSSRGPSFVVAADLIKRSTKFTFSQQQNFQIFARQKLLPMNTMSSANNFGNWGLLLVVSTATYLQDQTLFNQAVGRWKYFIEDQMNNDGVMRYEVGRGGGKDGIWYSNFALFPQTTSAEIMKVNGVNVFGYVSPSGRTLKKAYDKMAGWNRYPCSFPYYNCPTHGVGWVSYMEILNPIWPNANAAFLLGKYRPLDTRWSFPVVTLTHPNFK
jgi:Alginate lyase